MWQSAASLYIKEARKAAKLTLNPHDINERFHSTNLFSCFPRYQAPTDSVLHLSEMHNPVSHNRLQDRYISTCIILKAVLA